MNDRTVRCVYWVLLAISVSAFVVTSRFPHISHYLFSWDSVEFALAIKNYDPQWHQPHPPGFLFYVLLIRFVDQFVKDPNATMIWINIVSTIFGGLLLSVAIYELLGKVSKLSRFSLTAGAAFIFVTNSVVWVYGCVAEIYALESFFVALILCLFVYSLRAKHLLPLASLAMGIAGGFRLTTEIFLLFPYIIVLRGAERGTLLNSIVPLIISNAAWLIPSALLSGGLPTYMKLMWDQAERAASMTAVLGVDPMWRDTIPKLFIRLLQMATLPVVAALLLKLKYVRLEKSDIFILLFLLPPVLVFSLVHFAKEGYVLLLVPGIIILSISLLGKLYDRRNAIILSVLALSASFNYYSFEHAKLYNHEELQRSSYKRLKTEIMSPNRFLVWGQDRHMRMFMEKVSAIRSSGRAFITRPDSFPDWRLLMYYFPHDDVFLLLPSTGKKKKWAYHAKNHVPSRMNPPLILSRHNRLVLVLSNEMPGLSMNQFQIFERTYYYQFLRALPDAFQLYSFRFVKE